MTRPAKDFFAPLAVGAPAPLRAVPARPSRAIHFFDPGNPKMAAKVPGMVGTVDVLLGNLEDAIKADSKEAAREGLVRMGQDAEDIHYVDRILAQLEAKAGLDRPILVHAILETARGVACVEEICGASPRMQGISLGPADLAADRRMKTTRVGGGHPGYLVRQDPVGDDVEGERATYQQDLWHYTVARMVDACAANGIYAYYGPFGDIKDVVACEDQFRNAYLLGCVGAWSLHPVQVDIAKRVFDLEDAVAPDAKEAARSAAVAAATSGEYGGKVLTIRCNGLDTPWGAADLEAAAAARPDAVVVPKVSGAAHLKQVTAITGDVPVWAMVETPAALFAVREIAAFPQVSALVMGTNDLAKELRAALVPGRAPLVPHLATALLAAREAGVAILDGVYNDVKDLDGFRAECLQGKDMGFDGKTLIHPSQVEVANEVWAPTEDEITQA